MGRLASVNYYQVRRKLYTVDVGENKHVQCGAYTVSKRFDFVKLLLLLLLLVLLLLLPLSSSSFMLLCNQKFSSLDR